MMSDRGFAMGLWVFALSLCWGMVLADKQAFNQDLKNLVGKGLLLSSKSRISSTPKSKIVLNLNDYFYLNRTIPAYSDLLLDYSSDSKFHRIIVTPKLGGVLHSAVGYSARFVSSRRYPYSLLRNKGNKRLPPFEKVTEFTSDCNATKKDMNLFYFNYVSMPQYYPKVKISGPTNVFSLATLLSVNASGFDWNVTQTSIGSSKFQLLSCNNCSSTGLTVSLGFPFGLDTLLSNLQYAKVSFSVDEVNTTVEYFIHKIDVLDNPEDTRNSGDMQPQDGVFCDLREFEEPYKMRWPSHLSLSSEHVNFKTRRVSFVDEWYDYGARLQRLDIRGPRLTVNTSETDSDNVEYASMVLDFNSQLAFVRDLEHSTCKVTTHRKLNFLKHIYSDTSAVVSMAHPLDAFDFNETMNFKGYCEDSFGVPGKLYFSKAADDNELCVADEEEGVDKWHISANYEPGYYLPMWLTDYGRHASKTEGNENSHELEEITNFMDVSNRKALHDVFDVSSCLKSDHVTYYALLAAKETTKKEPKSDSSSDLLYSNYTVCMSTYEQRDAPMCCESIREDKSATDGLNAVYLHVASRYLASVLEVYSTRISYVALNDEAPQFSVIAFALLDFAGISDIASVNARKEMRSNERVMATHGYKLEHSFYVSLQVRRTYENGSEVLEPDYTDVYNVISVNEISEDTYTLILEEGKLGGHSNLMLVMMITVGMIMILVGGIIGVGIAYKLWRGATSFGYMIHSNLS